MFSKTARRFRNFATGRQLFYRQFTKLLFNYNLHSKNELPRNRKIRFLANLLFLTSILQLLVVDRQWVFVLGHALMPRTFFGRRVFEELYVTQPSQTRS